MRCHASRVQRWNLCRTLGTCLAFVACILTAAAATAQKKGAVKKEAAKVEMKKTVRIRGESVSLATPSKSASTEQSIEQALRTKSDFEFKDATLTEVVESLKNLTKLEIQLDNKALEDMRIATDTPVTFSAKNMSVQNALRLMLRSVNVDLTWVADDNALLITSHEVADDKLETRVYAVQDLVAVTPSYPFEGMYVPGVSNGGFPRSAPADSSGGGGMGGGGMGGGMFSVPDNIHSDKVSSAPGVTLPSPHVLAQMAQPPKGGAARGAARSNTAGGAARAGANQPGAWPFGQPREFDMDSLIDTITSCIKPTTWDTVGGPGSISPIGGMLVVSQTQGIHQEIEKLLENLRASSPGLKTVTIRATWLLLSLKQLDQLSNSKSGKDGGIDRKALDEMAGKAKGYIGAVTCLSGQTVHIASGRNHSAVVGAVPVVGGGGEGDNVGYQPIMSNPQSGAMLQITPQILPNAQAVLLDLCSSVTRAEISLEPIHFLGGEKVDAKKDANTPRPTGNRTTMNLDRVNVVVGQLATTLRIPLGQPTLVGGLTREPAADEQEAADTPQLYLFIEATVK